VCRCLCSNLSCIPSGITLEVVLLDHMADLFLDFYKASILFSIVVYQLTFLPIVCEGSFFPESLPTFVVGGVLNGSNSNKSKVES
jgi:hypothetical protein